MSEWHYGAPGASRDHLDSPKRRNLLTSLAAGGTAWALGGGLAGCAAPRGGTGAARGQPLPATIAEAGS